MKRSALLVDFYALTMASVYHRFKPRAKATFDLVIRRLPENRAFLIACGIEDALAYLKDFSFSKDDINYLKRFNFEKNFLKFLSRLRFSGDVWALKEGSLVFPQEPILRVTADLSQAQLVEAYLLNAINVQSAIASKAARVVRAAGINPVFDFSLRRTQGIDASLKAARASYIAGCEGTSNVLAGKLFGIRVVGTMAHSYVMSFGDELKSFRAYAEMFPDQSVLLLDTYNYEKGIEHAISIARELKLKGFRLLGVRLDSGNLVRESRKIRKLLDKNGLSSVSILASGNLDEYKIARLMKSKAPINAFGVGTNMGVSTDAPYCDVIYKISEITNAKGEFYPTMKLSMNKATYPGRKQVYRIKDAKGKFVKDILALDHEKIRGTPLLAKVMNKGHLLRPKAHLDQIRNFTRKQVDALPVNYKSLKAKKTYPVIISRQLRSLMAKLKKELTQQREVT